MLFKILYLSSIGYMQEVEEEEVEKLSRAHVSYAHTRNCAVGRFWKKMFLETKCTEQTRGEFTRIFSGF